MKWLATILFILATFGAKAQQQCVQFTFSGRATQNQDFKRALNDHLIFEVVPRHLKEDAQWSWFEISVVPSDESGVFVFAPGDRNWLLDVTDLWSVFMGGPNSNLNDAMQYRSRLLVFPVASVDKQAAREAVSGITEAQTDEELSSATSALQKIRLAHIRFDITDYALVGRSLPTTVEWVRFHVTLTTLAGVLSSADSGSRQVPCPAIPADLVQNIRDPKRHSYVLAKGVVPPG